ncbi:Interferon- developmental regulator 1 [Dispira simplex]|nr:Interferon- developmental regulator 1 [Dispira simplex]
MSLMQRSFRAAASGGKIAKGLGSARSTPQGSRRGTPAPSRTVSEDEASDSEDDTESVFSQSTIYRSGEDGPDTDPDTGISVNSETLDSLFRSHVDRLGEKRVGIREAALQWLVRALALRYTAGELASCQETLLDHLKRCVRSGKSTRESLLAARAIGLWFITLGVEQEETYQEVAEFLRPLIKSTRTPAVKAQLILSLALAGFIASGDIFETADTLSFLLTILRGTKESPEVCEAGMVSFGLLYSLLGQSPQLMERVFKEAFPTLLRLLQSDNVHVRISSGQNFALVYDLFLNQATSVTMKYDEPGLLQTIHQLATDSSKRRSKKERSQQRAIFREVLHTVENGDDPEMKYHIQKHTLVFNDWVQIHRLNAFRTALNEGLHAHFEANTLLQDVFDTVFEQLQEEGGFYSERVVHSTKSKVAKERALLKNKRRDVRYQAIHEPFEDLVLED